MIRRHILKLLSSIPIALTITPNIVEAKKFWDHKSVAKDLKIKCNACQQYMWNSGMWAADMGYLTGEGKVRTTFWCKTKGCEATVSWALPREDSKNDPVLIERCIHIDEPAYCTVGIPGDSYKIKEIEV